MTSWTWVFAGYALTAIVWVAYAISTRRSRGGGDR